MGKSDKKSSKKTEKVSSKVSSKVADKATDKKSTKTAKVTPGVQKPISSKEILAKAVSDVGYTVAILSHHMQKKSSKSKKDSDSDDSSDSEDEKPKAAQLKKAPEPKVNGKVCWSVSCTDENLINIYFREKLTLPTRVANHHRLKMKSPKLHQLNRLTHL